MSYRRKVQSLRRLALDSAIREVIYTLSDDLAKNCQMVGQCYEFVPAEIVEDILSLILCNQKLKASTRFCCLKVLLNRRVKKLSTGIFPNNYYRRIFKIIATKGLGLTYLNLEGVSPTKHPRLLCNIIKNLTRMQSLCIRSKCPFTTGGLAKFSRMLATKKTNLTVIDIGTFDGQILPHESIAELIELNPQLISLYNYSYVGKALCHIFERNESFQCKLSYIYDERTTKEICDAIFKMCPEVSILYLEHPMEGVIENIGQLTTLSTLRLYKFQCSELQALLSTSWDTLQIMHLSLGKGVLDMSVVARACTKLTSLRLTQVDSLLHTNNDIFASLEKIDIMWCNCSSPCMKYILGRSPALRTVDIYIPVYLTDDDLRRLCAEYSLMCLETFNLMDARNLTVNAVELLIGHCPELHTVGLFAGWNVSNNDVNYLRTVARATKPNINLVIDRIH